MKLHIYIIKISKLKYNTPQKLDNKLRYTMKEKKHYL
jgi:hypothetical protein